MEELLSSLKAVAEITRMRILFALSHGELNVTELTQILDQSQPRVSRHLKLMVEAGLIMRHKEGNWVVFRLEDDGTGAQVSKAIVAMLPHNEATLRADLSRIQQIKKLRAELAATYFSNNAKDWARLRSLHVDDEQVETAIAKLIGDRQIETFVDLGTGTGRMMELFAKQSRRLIGIDLSREMLGFARANMDKLNATHVQIRQASLYALPLNDHSADIVMLHQVLHFLDDPLSALREAARVLKPDGNLIIVDFAPHDREELRQNNAHRRLGLAPDQIARWLSQSGLAKISELDLPPPSHLGLDGLTVKVVMTQLTSARQRSALSTTEAA
jgi:ubiquinone/menaquinone biosynthesis C-methylase UbiE/DNA-binding HxlR family transcriptional regulator